MQAQILNKKGALSLGDMKGAALVLVTLAIVLGIGATILTTIQTDQTSDSFAYNATQGGLEAVDQLADWQTTIAVVIAAVVVLSLVAFLGVTAGRR